jgi:hypothetical protein
MLQADSADVAPVLRTFENISRAALLRQLFFIEITEKQ